MSTSSYRSGPWSGSENNCLTSAAGTRRTPPRSQPAVTRSAEGSPSQSSASPPMRTPVKAAATARLPPLQPSRGNVPLDEVVASYASARPRAQPAPSSAHTGSATASAAPLTARDIESDRYATLGGSRKDSADVFSELRSAARRDDEEGALSPSVADGADKGMMMPPSPAYTIAPHRHSGADQGVPSLSNSSPSPSPGSEALALGNALARRPFEDGGGDLSSSARQPSAPTVAHSARRPGEAALIPRSGRRICGVGGAGRGHPAARSTKAIGQEAASLMSSVRHATKAWISGDEARPLPNRHRLAPTSVTVQDQLLSESRARSHGGGDGGGSGVHSRTSSTTSSLHQRDGQFSHILDMDETTARAYLGDGRASDDIDPFNGTAPASLLLLTTDSGMRYGATVNSLAELMQMDGGGGGSSRGGQASFANTLTPPPSPGVYINPGSPALMDNTLLSTQPVPPRWAGTLTTDRQRDHPRQRGAGAARGRLPPMDATATELAALTTTNTQPKRDLGLTDTWISSVRGEEQQGAENSFELARALFHRVIRSHPTHHLFVDGGEGQMMSLASHVAVSSLLLDQMVVSLPRHNAVLIPYVQLLLRHLYVPDSPGVREALGGTVVDDGVLEGLLAACAACREAPNTGEGGSENGGVELRGLSVVARAGGSLLGPTSPEALLGMLLPYARKPFFLAHLELSQRVVAIAHDVRCREAHFQRLPLVITKMQSSWSKSLLRTVLRLWARLCRDRRLQERKLRQRWARRWAAERLSSGVRRWREYASDTLKSAEVNSKLRRQIDETRGAIERLNGNVEAMRQKTHELNKALLENEVERQRTTLASAATEQTYKEVLERVRELDQVGTSLLEGLLLTEPLPLKHVGLGAENELEESAWQAPQPQQQQLSASPTGETGLGASMPAETRGIALASTPSALRLAQPLACLNSLTVMVAWANDLIAEKGRDTELLCLMPVSPIEETLASPIAEDGGAAAAPVASPKAASPTPALAEAEVRAQLATTFDSLLDPAVPLTRIPVYKYLVLMRAFGEDDLNVPTLAVTRLVKAADEQVQAALGEARNASAGASSSGTADPTSVKGKLALSGGAGGASGGGGEVPFVPLMDQLPDSVREAGEQVTRILVDCYEQLTGTACVTAAEQLFPRRRQVWLVFLAGLFRHYTNWIIRKGQSDMANLQAEMDALDAELDNDGGGASQEVRAQQQPSSSAKPSAVTGKVDEKRHLGRRHPKNDAWYFPPHQHRRWPLLVQQQQAWIAESLNALHFAVEEAQRSDTLLTLEEQEDWGRVIQCLPVTAMSDLLPAQPRLSSEAYVSVLRVVERHYSRLRALFETYAIPYADVVEQRALFLRKDRERQLRAMRRLGATAEELAAMRLEAEAEVEALKEREFLEHPMPVMTVHAFWALLRTAGLAGTAAERNPLNPLSRCLQPDAEAFTSLHRPAVFSIVECVAQRTLSERLSRQISAVTSSNVSPPSESLSFSGGIGITPRRRGVRQRGATRQSPDEAVMDTEADAARRRDRSLCFLGNVPLTRLGAYSRAVDEGRHVDLREDHGVLCLTLPQFLEAVLRCVHTWVCLNRQPPLPKAQSDGAQDVVGALADINHASPARGQSGASLMRPSITASARGSVVHDLSGDFSAPGAKEKPHVRSSSPAFTSHQGSFSSGAQLTGMDSAVLTATTPRHRRGRRPYVAYEPYVDDHEALQPPAVEFVLRDFLLPNTLGARSVAATPFDLACQSPALRHFFALHHDTLYKVFEQFAEPVEAQGMVRALPPPLSNLVSDTVALRSSLAGSPHAHAFAAAVGNGNGDGLSGTQTRPASRPITARRQSSASRRSSTLGLSRDVGIVSVLTTTNAIVMAKQLQWGNGAGVARRRRLAPSAIQHCLVAVVADQRREGEVLFFSEFAFFLCAVAHFIDPNPFTPLEVKVKKFVQERVLTAIEDEDEDEDEEDDVDRKLSTSASASHAASTSAAE